MGKVGWRNRKGKRMMVANRSREMCSEGGRMVMESRRVGREVLEGGKKES